MARRTPVVLLPWLLALGCADWITDIPPYASVDVEARRLSGEPVPGAPLTLFIGSRIMGKGVTGADGNYHFDFLPKNAYGVYADPPEGYVRPEVVLGGSPTSIITEGLNLPEGGHGVAQFTYLKVGPGTVDARVTDPGGSPLALVPTALYNSRGVLGRGVTDGDGRVRFDPVPFGLWGLSFELPDEFLDLDQPAVFLDGVLVEEGTQAVVDFAAERCEGTMTVDVHDPVGEPVPGHPVVLYDDKGGLFPGTTDADGSHTFQSVLCGHYGVRLQRLPGWDFQEGRGKSFLDGFTVHRGTALQAAFEVVRCEGSIRVRVVDAGGAAVPGAGLTVYNSLHDVAQGVTDATGQYVLPALGCDEYGVKIEPPAGYSVVPGRGSSFFDGLFVQKGTEVLVTFKVTAP